MTNARVTGSSEEKIRERLRKAGVEHPLVLAGDWVCATIAAHRELRLFVPRVYGLGDLSQILDERAYAQASALIAATRDQVATFVITEPYRRAAEAVQDHGFVLLLGEPAVGKSVIALMLALAAADNWDCLTVKARTASELVDRWNPHEPSQVDDAFGDVRHQDQLTHDWARSMPHVMTAISKGARVAGRPTAASPTKTQTGVNSCSRPGSTARPPDPRSQRNPRGHDPRLPERCWSPHGVRMLAADRRHEPQSDGDRAHPRRSARMSAWRR